MAGRTLRHACSIVAIALVPALAGAAEAVLDVRVDADTVYEINGVSRIQSAVFGVTAYEGAPWPATPEYQNALRQSGISCLGFPGSIGWCAPGELPEDGAAGVEAWYESDEALREITSAEPLNGARYMYGQILPACRKLGIEPMMYILGGSHWSMGDHEIPKNNELYAVQAAAYVALLKRIDPKLRWVHLLNEPNSHWYEAGKGGKDYAEMFKIVAAAIKKKCPDVMVGGPVLCWPPAWPPGQTNFPNWYQWDSWTMPLIRTAGETLDFYDFHYYGARPDIAVEEVATVAGALYLHRGRRIPVAVTECGTRMTPEEAADPTTHFMTRTLTWERIVMAYLDRPATVMTMQMHDLHAMAGGAFQFMKSPDPNNQLPTCEMYRVWRHFRGTRLAATVERGPVKVMAAMNGKTAVCMVFNDQAVAREVEVSLRGVEVDGPVMGRWECIYLDRGANEMVRGSGRGARFRAPPYSTCAVLFDLPGGREPTRVARRVEFFGNRVMNEFEQVGQHLPVSLRVPAQALAGATSARVRVGLLGSKASDRLTMTLGREAYPLAGGTYFQEVDLGHLPTAGTTTLDFTLVHREGKLGSRDSDGPENRLRVSSVSLVIEK